MPQTKDFQEFSNSSCCSSEITEQFLLWAIPVPTVYRDGRKQATSPVHCTGHCLLPKSGHHSPVSLYHIVSSSFVQFQTMHPSLGQSKAFPGWPLMCMCPWVQTVPHFLAVLFPVLSLLPSRHAHLSHIPHKALLTSSDCPIAKQLLHGQLPRTSFLLPNITSTSRQCSVGWIRIFFLLTQLQIINNNHLPHKTLVLFYPAYKFNWLGVLVLGFVLFCFCFRRFILYLNSTYGAPCACQYLRSEENVRNIC